MNFIELMLNETSLYSLFTVSVHLPQFIRTIPTQLMI